MACALAIALKFSGGVWLALGSSTTLRRLDISAFCCISVRAVLSLVIQRTKCQAASRFLPPSPSTQPVAAWVVLCPFGPLGGSARSHVNGTWPLRRSQPALPLNPMCIDAWRRSNTFHDDSVAGGRV